jgi:putative chitinase
MRDAIEWVDILVKLGVKPQTAGKWADAFAEVVDGDDLAIAHFLGQMLHESAHLEHVEENLRYSAERLTKVWPKRFPTIEAAAPYANDPAKLANRVYGGRMGNLQPGDGFKYRGRGPIQLTGYDNYRWAEEKTGIPLVDNPDLLTQPYTGLRVAVVWFEYNAVGKIPDGVEAVTKAVNGGVNGLADREALTASAINALTKEA